MGSTMRQLNTLDAQFLGVESPRTFSHFSVLGIYDGELTVEDLRRRVGERLHLLPPFRWRLVEVPLDLDLPYWVEDPDFDLGYHIREAAVPPPGDDRKVAEVVERIVERPLDRSRPLWELYLLRGLRDGRVELLTKVHHSAADGVSGNELLTAMLDPTPNGGERTDLPDDHPHGERVPGGLEMLGRALGALPRHPLRTVARLPRVLPTLTDIPGANAFPGVARLSHGLSRLRARDDEGILEVATARAPRTCFNGPISPRRRFAFGSISLERVKAIKNATGTTVNDVLVALCARSLRGWLAEHCELPEDPLVAMIPVSIRPPGEERSFGNRISFMVVPIPTTERDPLRALQRAHEPLRSAKERHRALPAEYLTDASSLIPPAMLALAARTTVDVLSRTRPPVNLVISNIPGPREALYCAGARLEAAYPVSVIVDGVGLNITVLSYQDHIDIGIVADREQVDDTWSMIDGIQAALDELELAL
ncbi:MAG: diacylglycerol O-acyltransferase / wax synthase [Thermoleophilaceae bacterium]|jgi:WS/DGAT/MGAT family acyltransferase|nr:diacylglycerol O-acyltransferase / wax synthase [Thermoleophilaceae bacterium]